MKNLKMFYSISLFLLLILLAACGVIKEYEENVSGVKWLPSTASNVSYHNTNGFVAFEFGISDENFKLWINGEAWKKSPLKRWDRKHWFTEELKKIAPSNPFTIIRFNVHKLMYLKKENKFDEYFNKTRAVIYNGLYYQKRAKNGGGVSIAYDSKNNKAYVEASPR